MLANSEPSNSRVGSLSSGVQRSRTFLHELIEFIANELPVWRDRPNRKRETAETILTSQLCAHLNSAARRSVGWDVLQFRVEEPDENEKGRRVDLVPSPAACEIIIEGRKHIDFDSLMPIECKRMPTPKSDRRDEREYVFSSKGAVGGIQRFKAGYHGSAHSLGAMIGYVQEEAGPVWHSRVDGWISALVGVEAGWGVNDRLSLDHYDAARRLTSLRSTHARQNDLPNIDLRHIWVGMA
jgi:hypothetical protein